MNNIIPISLLTKKMQFFRGKKLDDDCPICLQPMYSKKVKKLQKVTKNRKKYQKLRKHREKL
jgi:hypothetical protein